MAMVTVELRISDFQIQIDHRRCSDALEQVYKHALRLGLDVSLQRDHRTKEAVLIVQGEGRAVQQLQLEGPGPKNLPGAQGGR